MAFCYSIRGSGSPIMSNSPIHMNTKLDVVFTTTANTSVTNPIGINSVSSTNSNTKLINQSILSPSTSQQSMIETDDFTNSGGAVFIAPPSNISKDATPMILAQWLNMHRLGQYVPTFSQFSGADLLRMSKEDLVQICGIADGIRLYNTLHSKYVLHQCVVLLLASGWHRSIYNYLFYSHFHDLQSDCTTPHHLR